MGKRENIGSNLNKQYRVDVVTVFLTLYNLHDCDLLTCFVL